MSSSNLAQATLSILKIQSNKEFLSRAEKGELKLGLNEVRTSIKLFHERVGRAPSYEELKQQASDNVSEEVYNYIRDEQEAIGKSEHSHWIIDESTGLLAAPVNQQTIVKSVKYDSSGNQIEGSPYLHPAITSAMLIRKQQIHNIQKRVDGSEEEIKYAINDKLVRSGIKICSKGKTKEIEVWRESPDGKINNRNKHFNMVECIASIFIRRVERMNFEECSILDIEEVMHENESVYNATVMVKEKLILTENSTPRQEPKQ